MLKIGVIGSGSWGTAQVKILTDKGNRINWTVRNTRIRDHLLSRGHNPQYLSSVHFNPTLLDIQTNPADTIQTSDIVIVATPSAYLEDVFQPVRAEMLLDKKVVSAVKGMIPGRNQLLNEFLQERFNFPLKDYFTVMGPCHAEEVAAEKLSYLTFSGVDDSCTHEIAQLYSNDYIRTIVNSDVIGVQYAGIMKNIYALGAGIAHGLEYGDNFLSVFIANAADEMAGFLRVAGVTVMEPGSNASSEEDVPRHNYAASVYLGDLLVTSYSLFSRNRTFGNMIGKGYSVRSAQLEMNMVAEGYNASRAIMEVNKKWGASMPIATAIYNILWEQLSASEGFSKIEKALF